MCCDQIGRNKLEDLGTDRMKAVPRVASLNPHDQNQSLKETNLARKQGNEFTDKKM